MCLTMHELFVELPRANFCHHNHWPPTRQYTHNFINISLKQGVGQGDEYSATQQKGEREIWIGTCKCLALLRASLSLRSGAGVNHNLIKVRGGCARLSSKEWTATISPLAILVINSKIIMENHLAAISSPTSNRNTTQNLTRRVPCFKDNCQRWISTKTSK